MHMRKEFGKWLMDIAKYIATAVVVTSIFGDIEQKWIIFTISITTIIFLLIWGLWLVKDKNETKKQ